MWFGGQHGRPIILPLRRAAATTPATTIELRRTVSRLSCARFNFSYVFSTPRSSTNGRTRAESGERNRIFCAVHFHYHVLCDVSSAKEAAGATTTFDLKYKDRRPRGDERRHSRPDLERERDHR